MVLTKGNEMVFVIFYCKLLLCAALYPRFPLDLETWRNLEFEQFKKRNLEFGIKITKRTWKNLEFLTILTSII